MINQLYSKSVTVPGFVTFFNGIPVFNKKSNGISGFHTLGSPPRQRTNSYKKY